MFTNFTFLNRNNAQFTIEELKNIVSSDNIAFCSEKTIEIVLNYLSITINEYKQFHILNPSVRIMKLQDKPIIRTSEKGHTIYIVPSSPYFAEKVFCGLFYDIESFFKKRCDFRTQFGKIFEEYVGQILELYSANYKIIPEKEIKYKKNKTDALFADWTAISEDEILIIETKSIKMPLKDIYNTTISEFIRTHIIDAYEQILNKVIDIETHPYFESLRQKEITPIIVFRDVPFLHSSLFLNKLNEMIEEKKKSAGQNSIWELLNTHKIYMFTVDDFELYWANKEVVSIKDLFAYMRENLQKSFCECLKNFSADLCEHRIFNEILPDALK